MRATQDGGPSVACDGGSSQLHPFMDGDGEVDEDINCYRRQAEEASRRDEEATEQIERLSEDMEQAARKHLDFVQERETQLYQTRKEMRDAIGLMEGAMKEHLKAVEEKSQKAEQEINHITQRRIDHLEAVLKSAGLKAKFALDQKAREKELRMQAEILLEQRTHRIMEQSVQLSERNLRIQDLESKLPSSNRSAIAVRELNGVDPSMNRHSEHAQRQAGPSNEHVTEDQTSHSRDSAPPPPPPVHAMDVDGLIQTGADGHQDGEGRPDGGEERPELPDATSRETRSASTPLSQPLQPMERPTAQDQERRQHREGHEDRAGDIRKGGHKRKRTEDGEEEFGGEDTEWRGELDEGEEETDEQQHPTPQREARGRVLMTGGMEGTNPARLLSQDTELTLTLSSAGTGHAGGRQVGATSTSASGASQGLQSEDLGHVTGTRPERSDGVEEQDEGTEEHKEHRRSGLQHSLGASHNRGASAGHDHAVDGRGRRLRKHQSRAPPPPADKVPPPPPVKQSKKSTGKDGKKSAHPAEDLPWSELPDWFVAFCQWMASGKSFDYVIPKSRREALRGKGSYKGALAAHKPKEGQLGSSPLLRRYAKVAYDLLTDIAGDNPLPETEVAARKLVTEGIARFAKILGPHADFNEQYRATIRRDKEDKAEVWAPWYLWQYLIGPEASVPGARVSASTKTKNPEGKWAASRQTSQQHDAGALLPKLKPSSSAKHKSLEFPAIRSISMTWLTAECKLGLWEHLLELQISEGTRQKYMSDIGKLLERVFESVGREAKSTMSAQSLFDVLSKHKSVVKEALLAVDDKIYCWNHLVRYLNRVSAPGSGQLENISKRPKDGAPAGSVFDFSERDEGQAVQPISSQSNNKKAAAAAREPSTAGLRRSGRCKLQLQPQITEPEPEMAKRGDGPMHPMEDEGSPMIDDDDDAYASTQDGASWEHRSIEVASLPHDTVMQEMDRMEVEDSTLAPAGSQVVNEPAASTATSATATATPEASASALPPFMAPLLTSEPAVTGEGLPPQSGDQQDDDEPPGLDISETQQHPPPEQPQPQQPPASEQQQPVVKQMQLDTSADAGGSRHSSACITPESTPGFFSQHAPPGGENTLAPLNPQHMETVSADDHVQGAEDDEDGFDAHITEEADGEGPFAGVFVGICGSVPQGSTERINPLFDKHNTRDVDPQQGGREKGADGVLVNHEDW